MDQQRTRKITRIVAIIMVVGLVGVLPIALGLIIFGGNSPQDTAGQLIKDAEAKVAANPANITALVDLATQYQSNGRAKDASDTLDKAIAAGPKNIDDLRVLAGALGNDQRKQIAVLKAYTKKFPKDGEGWYAYGTTAAGAGETLTARLALQKALDLAKPGSQLAQNAKTALANVNTVDTTQIVPTTPTTP